MEISFFCESRDYLRVKANVPVRFRFTGEHLEDAALAQEYEGVSRDLSGGGLLLRGPVPDESWIPDLLMERITIVVHVFLPDAHEPVRARARVAWIDTGKGARKASETTPHEEAVPPQSVDEHDDGHDAKPTTYAAPSASAESEDSHASLGLKFVQIAREDQDRLFQYILEDLLP